MLQTTFNSVNLSAIHVHTFHFCISLFATFDPKWYFDSPWPLFSRKETVLRVPGPRLYGMLLQASRAVQDTGWTCFLWAHNPSDGLELPQRGPGQSLEGAVEVVSWEHAGLLCPFTGSCKIKCIMGEIIELKTESHIHYIQLKLCWIIPFYVYT